MTCFGLRREVLNEALLRVLFRKVPEPNSDREPRDNVNCKFSIEWLPYLAAVLLPSAVTSESDRAAGGKRQEGSIRKSIYRKSSL